MRNQNISICVGNRIVPLCRLDPGGIKVIGRHTVHVFLSEGPHCFAETFQFWVWNPRTYVQKLIDRIVLFNFIDTFDNQLTGQLEILSSQVNSLNTRLSDMSAHERVDVDRINKSLGDVASAINKLNAEQLGGVFSKTNPNKVKSVNLSKVTVSPSEKEDTCDVVNLQTRSIYADKEEVAPQSPKNNAFVCTCNE